MTPPVSSPAIKVVKSVREQVSPEEWQTRVDLAACYRLVAMYGYTEMIANHISCRVPGSHDHFLINPYGMLYEEIDASCLIKIDVDGNTLFNASDYGVNAAGFVIHSAIHMARKDMDCVAHTHTPAGMAVSAMECGLLPLAQTSMRFLHIGYHDFEGIADDVGERERLVADLGNHEAMILRNHGLLVVGRTIPAHLQPAVPDGARLRGAGDGAVLQHQAGVPAAGRAGSDFRQGEAAPEHAEPQRRPRLAGAAAQARPHRSARTRTELFANTHRRPRLPMHRGLFLSAFQRGTTAVASISTRAAFSTSRTTWTSAIAG